MKKLISIYQQNTAPINSSTTESNVGLLMEMVGSGNETDQNQRLSALPKHRGPTLTTPCLIEQQGAAAKFAWEEFIYGRIRNSGTRRAYSQAVTGFLKWCETLNVELTRIAPAHVGRYLDSKTDWSSATRKLHLSALRHFFDELVLRHVVILNPALSVRTERLTNIEGKTPEISIQQTRQLLDSIDNSHLIGCRDKTIISILVYTAARVGAVAKLRRDDFVDYGDNCFLRMMEKRNKFRQLPVRHDLSQLIRHYLKFSGLELAEKRSPLFRTTVRRTGLLTKNRLTPNDISRMLKRRLKDAGLSSSFSPHSFRVTTITDLLSQGVPLEDVQLLAGHSDPRTTRLYDRRDKEVTRNIVERISI